MRQTNIPLALSYGDVLLVPQYSKVRSRKDINLKTKIAHNLELNSPLMSVNMDTITDIDMAVALSNNNAIGCLPRFDKPELQADKMQKITDAGARAIGAIEVNGDFITRSEMLLKAGAIALTIDTPHAHTAFTIEAITTFKSHFKDVPLLVGTIATYQAAYDLFEAGADSVCVGIGAGTICTTRIVAGSGVPQITAILEATRAKEKFPGRHVIADGGIVNSGDIVKALAAGASAVKIGSLFAGTDESPGTILEIEGKLYKEYNGSTSRTEKLRQLKKDASGKENHFITHVEGVESLVPYKGSVINIVETLLAGVRSGMSYSGALTVEELWEKAEFVQITAAGLRESQSHDVILR